MLLDDVMSELDSRRRELLAGLLRSGGQAVVTATEAEHVPGATEAELIGVTEGTAVPAVLAQA
jgi:DNA replication and repair protein RecF